MDTSVDEAEIIVRFLALCRGRGIGVLGESFGASLEGVALAAEKRCDCACVRGIV